MLEHNTDKESFYFNEEDGEEVEGEVGKLTQAKLLGKRGNWLKKGGRGYGVGNISQKVASLLKGSVWENLLRGRIRENLLRVRVREKLLIEGEGTRKLV